MNFWELRQCASAHVCIIYVQWQYCRRYHLTIRIVCFEYYSMSIEFNRLVVLIVVYNVHSINKFIQRSVHTRPTKRYPLKGSYSMQWQWLLCRHSANLSHPHTTKVCCASARLFINCNQVYCSFNSITNLFEIPLT